MLTRDQALEALTPRDRRIAATIGRHGIIRPRIVVAAARTADITIATACTLLEKETGGGHNIFGHDPTIYAGAGKVTREKYRAYKARRLESGNRLMQGVGPCQLTWWEIQDTADRAGGCWRPYYNEAVGFAYLASLADQHGSLREGARAYNGTGAAADTYARDFMHKRKRWNIIVREASR